MKYVGRFGGHWNFLTNNVSYNETRGRYVWGTVLYKCLLLFLLLSNLQFLCQSVTHVWMFLCPSQSSSFLSQKKKSSSHCITVFSDKKHYHEIIDCAGELQMLQHHQGHLTLSNVSYPMRRVLCSEIVLLQNGLTGTQRGCSKFEKTIFWEMLPTSKKHPYSGKKLVIHYGW